MDRLITESFLEAERIVLRPKAEDPSDTEDIKSQIKHDRSPVINVNVQNVNNLNIPVDGYRTNTSDSEWKTTTDTSINSSRSPSLSPVVGDVPREVLEACNGMDEVSIGSSSPVRPSSRRGRGRGRGRGQTKVTNNSRKTTQQGRLNGKQKTPSETGSSTSSCDSASDSGSESDSASGSERSVCSGSCSHSSCDLSYSCSQYSDSCCSCSSCSCSCHSDCSSTSYDSTDQLTDLPRAKKGALLGKKGSKKVGDKCSQS